MELKLSFFQRIFYATIITFSFSSLSMINNSKNHQDKKHSTESETNGSYLGFMLPLKSYSYDYLMDYSSRQEGIYFENMRLKMERSAGKLEIKNDPIKLMAFFVAHFTVNLTVAWSISFSAASACVEGMEPRYARDPHWDLAWHAVRDALSDTKMKGAGLSAWDAAMHKIETRKGWENDSWNNFGQNEDAYTLTTKIIKNNAQKEVGSILEKLKATTMACIGSMSSKLSNIYILKRFTEDNFIEVNFFKEAYLAAHYVLVKNKFDLSLNSVKKIIASSWKQPELTNNPHIKLLKDLFSDNSKAAQEKNRTHNVIHKAFTS